jgi:hypothetical protein
MRDGLPGANFGFVILHRSINHLHGNAISAGQVHQHLSVHFRRVGGDRHTLKYLYFPVRRISLSPNLQQNLLKCYVIFHSLTVMFTSKIEKMEECLNIVFSTVKLLYSRLKHSTLNSNNICSSSKFSSHQSKALLK